MAKLLREAAAALDEQRDEGSETATNMPAQIRNGEGRANHLCHSSARVGYFTEISSQGRYLPLTIYVCFVDLNKRCVSSDTALRHIDSRDYTSGDRNDSQRV